jgi:calcium binding protein 39
MPSHDFRYENEDVALNTGHILKEMLRHESIARILLYSDE